MSDPSQEGGGNVWPSAGVLLFCAILLVAGYGVAAAVLADVFLKFLQVSP